MEAAGRRHWRAMAEQTTFAEAIKAGRDVFERARASLGSLPCASDAAEKQE